MSVDFIEMAVAVVLMFLGAFGLAQGFITLRHGVYPRDVFAQMPFVSIGMILLMLGGYMSAQALAGIMFP